MASEKQHAFVDTNLHVPQLSPLKPIKRWLVVLQILGGFPMKIENPEASILTNSRPMTFCGIIVCFMVGGFLTVQHVLINQNSEEHLSMIQFMKNNTKMTDTEIASYYLTTIPHCFALLVNTKILVTIGQGLTRLCQKIMNLIDVPFDKELLEIGTKKNKTRIIILLLITLIGCTFEMTGVHQMNISPTKTKIMICSLLAFDATFVQMPPMILALQLFIVQILVHISAIISGLAKQCQHTAKTQKFRKRSNEAFSSEAEEYFEWIFSRATSIIVILKRTENLLGLAIFMEVALCMINLVVASFFSVGIVTSVIYNTKWPNPAFFHNCYQLCLTILCLVRLSSLMSSGEELTRNMKDFQVSLENVAFAHCEHLHGKTKFKIRTLIQKIQNSPAPIKPLNGFELTFSSFITSLGLLLTYIVILLQFKFSELTSRT